MTNQRHPVPPETDLTPPLMMDAIYLITVLAAAAGLPDVIIKAFGL